MSSTQRRSFSSQFKLETVLEYLRGTKPTAQICRERDITENLLYRWKQQFYERAPHLFEQGPTQPNHDAAQNRIAELERMVGRLTMELDILKKRHDRSAHHHQMKMPILNHGLWQQAEVEQLGAVSSQKS